MARDIYPSTTLQPVQTVTFKLQNGMQVRAVLKPQPNTAGTHVAHVDVDVCSAGSVVLNPFGNQGQPRTVIQAGLLAYQAAQHEANHAGGIKITEALLEGEEFLEKADVEQITGNAIPVTVV